MLSFVSLFRYTFVIIACAVEKHFRSIYLRMTHWIYWVNTRALFTRFLIRIRIAVPVSKQLSD